MSKAPMSLKLTAEQKSQLEREFGHKVDELHFSVEEFGIEGAKDSSMKVLKVSNVAKVHVAGIQSVVN